MLELVVAEIQLQDARVWTEKQEEHYTSRLKPHKWRDILVLYLNFDLI